MLHAAPEKVAGSRAASKTGAAVRLANVSVNFGPVRALDNVSFEVGDGDFLTLLGPSGCGKSTLLRVVSDLVDPSQGTVEVLGGTAEAARKRRDIGFVFQDAALLPWRTAIENVSLPLEIGRAGDQPNRRNPAELLELVGLGDRLDALPGQLSGGMRQRVSIARALVNQPKLLLMDEPFGALDEITRDHLNEALLRIWETTGVTIMFVTHSIYEAAFLSQKVLLLQARPGRTKEMIDIPLPLPRTSATKDLRDFVETSIRLRKVLETC